MAVFACVHSFTALAIFLLDFCRQTGVLRKVDEVSEVDIPATDNNGGADGARLLREAINSATNDRGTIFMAAISSGNPSIVQLVEECITAVYASDPAQVRLTMKQVVYARMIVFTALIRCGICRMPYITRRYIIV